MKITTELKYDRKNIIKSLLQTARDYYISELNHLSIYMSIMNIQ